MSHFHTALFLIFSSVVMEFNFSLMHSQLASAGKLCQHFQKLRSRRPASKQVRLTNSSYVSANFTLRTCLFWVALSLCSKFSVLPCSLRVDSFALADPESPVQCAFFCVCVGGPCEPCAHWLCTCMVHFKNFPAFLFRKLLICFSAVPERLVRGLWQPGILTSFAKVFSQNCTVCPLALISVNMKQFSEFIFSFFFTVFRSFFAAGASIRKAIHSCPGF